MKLSKQFITVRNKQILKRINLNELEAVIASGYCSTFYLANSEKFTCAKLLKKVEAILPPHIQEG